MHDGSRHRTLKQTLGLRAERAVVCDATGDSMNQEGKSKVELRGFEPLTP